MPITTRNLLRLTIALAVTLAGSHSGAHQQWLAPNLFMATGESAWISFDHTFGDQRFQPASGPGGYYSWWITGPDGLRRQVPFLFVGKTRTTGEVELEEAGTYRLEGVESMSWSKLIIDGEAQWQPGTREDYSDYEVESSRYYFQKALSYVTLQSASRGVLASRGEPLEILFEDHPNEWHDGKKLRIKVLAAGKPVPKQPVKIFTEHTEGHDEEAVCTTDRRGACEITAPSEGRILLMTSIEGEEPALAGTDGYYYGISVLLEVTSD
ncbi:MAG: DUF4198 domain-containing protein [Halieaceae bacterium]|nr:DUF4198 domain-containing protein [Halieaceae bacterium]